MKVERPPHHKPVTKEDVTSSSETGGEDITECFSRLSIYNVDSSKSSKSDVIPDNKKTSENDDNINRKVSQDEVKKTNGKESKGSDDAKPKDAEAQKEKKELDGGDLLSRGPVGVKPKWKTDSHLPYQKPTQTISGGTNGGCLLYDSQSAASFTEFSFEKTFSPEQLNTTQFYQQYNCPPLSTLELNEVDSFNQSIHEQSLSTNLLELPDLSQANFFDENTEVSDFLQEETLRKCIQEVTSDPVKVQSLLKDIVSEASKLNPTQIDPLADKITCNIQDQIFTNERDVQRSPSQVVPQRRTSYSSSSAYSTCSGSPSGPSSPYGNTPNFSPNILSPQGNLCDDSSNTMFSSPYTIMQSPLQRPLSSCSTSSTTCSSTDQDGFDLNEIFRPTDAEDKKKIQEIKQYLDTSCSEDYKANCKLQSGCFSTVQPTNSSIVMMFYGLPNQPSFQKKQSDGSAVGGRRVPRVILPKPSDASMLPPPGDKPLNVQEFLLRQPVKQIKSPQRHSTYPQPAKEQLLQRLDPVKKSRAWAKAQSPTDEEIVAVDQDGDTALMMLVCHEHVLQKLEHLYALVSRYKTIPGLLSMRNNSKQSALYMACMAVHREPLVAKYIAEALVDINYDLNMRDEADGSTLIHQLCVSDEYSAVLDGLLSLKDKRGKACFDINITDYEGRTPLHLSVEKHNSGSQTLDIVRVLLRHGANILEKDRKQGSTALHLALATKKPDEKLVHLLCNFCDSAADTDVQELVSTVKFDLVNAKNFKGDTPLHVAMAYGGCTESQTHNYILEILLEAGAARAIRNHNGKAPLELAPEARKAEIKRILDKYSSK